MIRRVPPSLAALLVAGCAQTAADRFPSLAPRATEQRGFAEPAALPSPAATPDPALDARVAAVVGEAAERARAFDTARSAAEAKVAAARVAAPGSDAWLDAQVALGGLDVLRAGTSETVTTLDQLAADRAVAGDAPYPALEAAVAEARARLAEVGATIAALNARLTR